MTIQELEQHYSNFFSDDEAISIIAGRHLLWLSCPTNCFDAYRQYMQKHNIPHLEKVEDGALCFVLSQQDDPHSWEIDFPECS